MSDVIAPIQLQVIGAALRSIAEEMGAVLIRSSFSANIKERRDCSTALFDERGRVIAQAEHIPVHLGAMPNAVAAVMQLGLEPGQVAILNDPYTGGTHLPDVTLVSRTGLGFAVSRAHHADVGGIEPASLPAFSHTLEEEGVILPPQLLTDEVLDRFVEATRQPEERRGGPPPPPPSPPPAQRPLPGAGPGRLPEPALPASGGAFAPVAVPAPEGCLVTARSPAAVVAGNTETSSRIVDVVFAALGRLVPAPAAGQGTMNNLAFGNDRFTYYETIGGGQGGCLDADGPSGVHVAMSNTLATPAEAIELEYPLRVERWELRLGSGGAGSRRGGDGVTRELRVLEDCRLSVLAERRRNAPPGRDGGGGGARGPNPVKREEQPPKLTRPPYPRDRVPG